MAKLRCRPGDLARIIRSRNPALIGRICLVERMHDLSIGRWEVKLLGAPEFDVAVRTKRPVVTHDFTALDVSLVPLRGDCPDEELDIREVDHA